MTLQEAAVMERTAAPPDLVQEWLIFLHGMDDVYERLAAECGQVYQRLTTEDLCRTATALAETGMRPAQVCGRGMLWPAARHRIPAFPRGAATGRPGPAGA